MLEKNEIIQSALRNLKIEELNPMQEASLEQATGRKAAVLQDRQPGNDETDPDPAKTEGRTDGAAEGVCGVSEKLGWMERQRAEACRLMISCRLL